MRKYLPVIFLVFFFVFLINSSPVLAQNSAYYNWSTTLETPQKNVLGVIYAQESTSSARKSNNSPAKYTQFNKYIVGGDLIPGSPFYFLKPLQENIQLAFTFDQKAKNKLRVEIAGERLDEIQKLAVSNNTAVMTTAVNSYQQTMSAVTDSIALLKKQNIKEDDLITQVEEETAKHDVILEQVRVRVPDQIEASIDKALEASWKGADMVADAKGRLAVPPDVVSRLESLKSQGLLTQEEVTKLIGAKSRSEARTEIGKYVAEGIVSPADFMRMNEVVKASYPDEFYKMHEVLRFQEMQKLESEKPDDAMLNKIQNFAKNYKAGDPVPPELRKYWVPVMRLEEIQNTLRPDLIDADLFKQNNQESKKFNEVIERFKPRPEDIALVNNFIQKNNADVDNLPPEYQRMYGLAQKYGAQCGAGFNWVPEPQNQGGGYCVPNGVNSTNRPKFDDFKGKSCFGSMVSAKGSGGACGVFTSDCIPPGWSKTDSCVVTSVPSGQGPTGVAQKISCPSNAHFVSVAYDPNGGYCIPNYTQTGFDQATGTQYNACPSGYHRNYAGGSCIPDYNTNIFNNPNFLPPLTVTPGGPYYTNKGQCGQGFHWVPEPINPGGGYCAADQGTYGVPKSDMGNCRTPGECYDFCKNNPGAVSCSGFNPSQSRPGDPGSRESQEAACRAGGGTCTSWNNETCGCTNNNPNSGPSREAQEAACRSGGGTCTGWFNGACSCIRGNNPSGPTPGGNPVPPVSADPSGGCPNYTPGGCGGSGAYFDFGSCSCKMNSVPPPGYGNCGSGLTWNGSACVSSGGTPSLETPPPSAPPSSAPEPQPAPPSPTSPPNPEPTTSP